MKVQKIADRQAPLNDDEALTVAKLILDGGAQELVGRRKRTHAVRHHVHQQAEDIEKLWTIQSTIKFLRYLRAEAPLAIAESAEP